MWLALALSTQLLRPAVVLDPVATMYSKPDALADVVSQAIYGTQVRILEEQEGWAKVETPDEYMGWMPLAAVRGLRDGEAGYATSGRVARVESLFANLYREPDVTLHEPLLTVPFETRLEVNAEPADDGARWIRVSLVDGELAWIARGDVIFDPPHLTPADLPALSKRFLGLPYLWGGTSTYGYDCSGLVQMLYRRLGVLLPRDAQPQAAFKGFAAVERKDLRPGDLVYFGSSDHHIIHTGIYLGGGEFISATVHEHPVVRVDRLDDPFWDKLFVAARRLK
ncbi:MAG TPA: C40 family peptidase [Bryobacteraceae bacterium]|nr:C40 family peptidase [Bryobacteraceae bacterium]